MVAKTLKVLDESKLDAHDRRRLEADGFQLSRPRRVTDEERLAHRDLLRYERGLSPSPVR